MRKELLLKLLDVTKRQEKALIYEEIDNMKVLLEEKQVILDAINMLNMEKDSTFSDDEKEVMEEIYKRDKTNNIEFKAQLKYAKEEVKKANMLTKREDYYSNPYSIAMESGIFFDRK